MVGGLLLAIAAPAEAQIVIGDRPTSDVIVNYDVLNRLGREPTLPDLYSRAAGLPPLVLPETAPAPHHLRSARPATRTATRRPHRKAKTAVAARPHPASPHNNTAATATAPQGGNGASGAVSFAANPKVAVPATPRIDEQPAAKPAAPAAKAAPPVIDLPKVEVPSVVPPPKAAEPAKPAEAVKPQPAPVVAPAEPAKPTATAKAEPAKPAEPVKPQPSPVAAPAEAAKPTETAKAEPAKPAESVKPQPSPVVAPAEIAKPTETAKAEPTKPQPAPVAAPAPTPTPTPTVIAALPPPQPAARKGDTLTLPFGVDSANLSESARTALEKLAQRMQGDEQAWLQVLAYAAGDEANASKARRLSLSRALEVRKFLMEMGVPSTRIEVRALGNKVESGPPDRVDTMLLRR